MRRFDPGWIVSTLAPLIGILPTFNGTVVPWTADGLLHIHRIQAMTVLLEHGDLYPRWVPWFHLGYGYPVFNYYPPAGTYLGGLLGVLGFSAPIAFMMVAALGALLGSVGMYALVRRYLPASTAILAAVLWSYAPSRMNEVWNQGSLPHLLASGLIPWIIWAAIRVVEVPNYRHNAIFALVLGAMILTHQPTTFILAWFLVPGVIGGILWKSWRQWVHIRSQLFHVGLGGLLGIGVAGVFLLPMALEIDYTIVDQTTGNVEAAIRTSFVELDQLFVQPKLLDWTDANWFTPRTFGIVTGLLALLGTVALLGTGRYGTAVVLVGAVFASLFLMTEISLDVWLKVPLMGQLRFPWRVFRVGVVFFAFLGGASLLLLPSRWRGHGAVIGSVVMIVSALPTLYAPPLTVDYDNLGPSDSIHYEVETAAFGTTSFNEFKPDWGNAVPSSPPDDLDSIDVHPMRIWAIAPESANMEIAYLDDRSVQVTSDEAFDLQFRQFFFPSWSATLDGAPIEITPDPTFGQMTIAVPAGKHTIDLSFTGTSVQNIAPFVTLVSLVAVGVLYFRGRQLDQETSHPVGLSPRLSAVIGIGVIVVALGNRFYVSPDTNWFRHTSPADSPAYMETPVHQQFGDAYELLGYTLHDHKVAPGGELEITLYWRALQPIRLGYHPKVQLVGWQNDVFWGTSEPLFIGPNPVVHTPDYFVSEQHIISLADKMPPYVGRISVQLLDNQTNQFVPLSTGTDTVFLEDIIRIEAETIIIEQELDYLIANAIELRCTSVTSQGDHLTLDLHWYVQSPPMQPDIRVFVHALDGEGNLVTQADAPPLSGDYPPNLWLSGQHLKDQYLLVNDPAIQNLLVGMYLPDGTRLPMATGEGPVPNDGILVPSSARECR